MSVVGGGRVEGMTRDGPATLHLRLRRHRRQPRRTRHRRPLPRRARLSRRRSATICAAFAGCGARPIRTCRSTSAPKRPQPCSIADRERGSLRALRPGATVASTRAGDFVCHWGESSGYSCAEVELTDYAPPGDFAAGPATDLGHGRRTMCIAGDSGGPVFSGSVAFGIAKGINRRADGRCAFYYYMSTDYLPPPGGSLRRDGR